MKKNNTNLDLPVISNKLKIVDWFEAYNTFFDECVGQSGAPFGLVSRSLVVVPAVDPALVADQPFSFDWGLVVQELVHRLSHTSASYHADNKLVFSQLVTTTLGTLYASMIASFKHVKDRCGALAALNAQFAGAAHWDKEVKVHDAVLRDCVFNGRSGTTIHKFFSLRIA